MDVKRVAMVIGITILLPLFLGLFFDALYPAPEYNDFCQDGRFLYEEKAVPAACNDPVDQQLKCTSTKVNPDGSQVFSCTQTGTQRKCAEVYDSPEAKACMRDEGNPIYSTDDSCCQVYEKCDYCNRDYSDATAKYNRNLFFILAPAGLAVIVIGIYWGIQYMGAGFMFGGLITLFYATVRYFSDMSKMLRALVILIELLVIIWLGYKKIGKGDGKSAPPQEALGKKPAKKR